MKKLIETWSSYKHRFVPWLYLNWRTRRVAIRPRAALLQNTDECISSLLEFLTELATTLPHHYLYADVAPDWAVRRGREVMERRFGFICERRRSGISKGGTGVFVTEGCAPKERLMCLYPGMVYLPFHPLLLVSIRNRYLLRCYDGVFVDGKSTGLSRILYRSCANRDRVGGRLRCDLSWLGGELVNPLSLGQRVNNQSDTRGANVEYIEMSLRMGQLAPMLQRLMPYTCYSSGSGEESVRVVGLVSTRQIERDEELLSNYLTVVNTTRS